MYGDMEVLVIVNDSDVFKDRRDEWLWGELAVLITKIGGKEMRPLCLKQRIITDVVKINSITLTSYNTTILKS